MDYFDLPLRPDQPSGVNRGFDAGGPSADRFLTSIGDPRLWVTLAPEPTGASVVLCPGGGYGGVCVDKEGLDFSRLLASWGVSSAVLLYRQPGGAFVDPPLPLADLRTALALVRENSGAWGLRADRVGVFGFSAGGHLAWASVKEPGDQGRPAFQILGYPVVSLKEPWVHAGSRQNLLGPQPPEALVDRFSGELGLPQGLGPTFLVHAQDDGAVPVANSQRLRAALQASGNECELLLHPTGGHGFGLGPAHGYGDAPDWTPFLRQWLVERGLAR